LGASKFVAGIMAELGTKGFSCRVRSLTISLAYHCLRLVGFGLEISVDIFHDTFSSLQIYFFVSLLSPTNK